VQGKKVAADKVGAFYGKKAPVSALEWELSRNAPIGQHVKEVIAVEIVGNLRVFAVGKQKMPRYLKLYRKPWQRQKLAVGDDFRQI
jgi:hypothetical protein